MEEIRPLILKLRQDTAGTISLIRRLSGTTGGIKEATFFISFTPSFSVINYVASMHNWSMAEKNKLEVLVRKTVMPEVTTALLAVEAVIKVLGTSLTSLTASSAQLMQVEEFLSVAAPFGLLQFTEPSVVQGILRDKELSPPVDGAPKCRFFADCEKHLLSVSAASMASLKQCTSLTLERKVALIKEVEKGGRTKSNIAQEFGIPLSTLSAVLKNKQKVLNGYQQSFSSQQKWVQGCKFLGVDGVAAKCQSSQPSHHHSINDGEGICFGLANGARRLQLQQQLV
ncbi:hypothetical protein HPB50_007278 [Hyalomma asiaticum]|uniref:Uncharacterized protein n=1 Tax=Hyalomma asiaticum TaxID=266040 RepID=A0ACB7RXE7_HYAAI|nr:hypothetical protein HPB50_007278 [Hyalomma asiaticum]